MLARKQIAISPPRGRTSAFHITTTMRSPNNVALRQARRMSAPCAMSLWQLNNQKCERSLRQRRRSSVCDQLCQSTSEACGSNENVRNLSTRPSNRDGIDDLESSIRYLLPNRLGFVSLPANELTSLKDQLQKRRDVKFVSSKLHRNYCPLCSDFGPVDLSVIYRFCKLIRKALDSDTNKTLFIYCIETDSASRANAAFLLASFLLLDCGVSPESAANFFDRSSLPFELAPFRDASYESCDFPLTIYDCLRGLRRAVEANWFSLTSFNLDKYEFLYDPTHGDIHQLCPQLIAFKGPLAENSSYLLDSEIAFPPAHYARVLKKLGATAIVRLNEPDTYDASEFEAAGLRHYDLFFPDCTAPSDDIADRFLDICDREPGTVAIHCRAGLGRTGTLAAVWLMARRGFTAREAIAWLRVVRPGSVIGVQQHYLKRVEAEYSLTPVSRSRTSSSSAGGLLPTAGPAPRAEEAGAAAAAAAAAAAKLAAQVQSAMQRKSEVASLRAAAAGGAAGAWGRSESL